MGKYRAGRGKLSVRTLERGEGCSISGRYLESLVLSYRVVSAAFGILVALRPILRVKEGAKSKFIVGWFGRM
jgi:hypothetical protein